MLERLATWTARAAGSTYATLLAFGLVLGWVTGGVLFFGFGDAYQMIINTGTTIITFLMVFLIQRAQNKQSEAICMTLNELVAALQPANNQLINAGDRTEAELHELHQKYDQLKNQQGDNDGH